MSSEGELRPVLGIGVCSSLGVLGAPGAFVGVRCRRGVEAWSGWVSGINECCVYAMVRRQDTALRDGRVGRIGQRESRIERSKSRAHVRTVSASEFEEGGDELHTRRHGCQPTMYGLWWW